MLFKKIIYLLYKVYNRETPLLDILSNLKLIKLSILFKGLNLKATFKGISLITFFKDISTPNKKLLYNLYL